MRSDFVAVEEPLEIRVHGRPLAVVMRSPGREQDLVAGFLASEGVLQLPEDLAGIEPCELQTQDAHGNVWNAVLAPAVSFDPRVERRTAFTGSACGMCGRRTLEELHLLAPGPAAPGWELDLSLLEQGFEDMRTRQELFQKTGGSHGVGLLNSAGDLLDVAEDVGRHNALDKVLGAQYLAGNYPHEGAHAVLVSGRISFEIVQKAALAQVSAVVGLGLPTSLAVEAAAEVGQHLVGLVRGGAANVYPASNPTV